MTVLLAVVLVVLVTNVITFKRMSALEAQPENQLTTVTTADTTIGTLTPAQVINSLLYINTGSTSTVTLPTATSILTALGGVGTVGNSFQFRILNKGSGSCTITEGTGTTVYGAGSSPLVITTGTSATLTGVISNTVTPTIGFYRS